LAILENPCHFAAKSFSFQKSTCISEISTEAFGFQK
jgi:hypothetical protein